MDSQKQYNDDDLRDLSPHLGTDQDFFPSDAETEALIAGVNERIDRTEKITPIGSHWSRMVAAAAALVLVAGTAFVSYNLGQVGTDNAAGADSGTVVSFAEEYDSDDLTMDEEHLAYLVSDASAGGLRDVSEQVLDDLSDEELDYLAETFDVGDLL